MGEGEREEDVVSDSTAMLGIVSSKSNNSSAISQSGEVGATVNGDGRI